MLTSLLFGALVIAQPPAPPHQPTHVGYVNRVMAVYDGGDSSELPQEFVLVNKPCEAVHLFIKSDDIQKRGWWGFMEIKYPWDFIEDEDYGYNFEFDAIALYKWFP